VKRKKMKKIIAIGVAMAVILVLASAGPVVATNSSGTLVEPGDSDRGLQSDPLLPVLPIGYIDSNSIFPPVCDIWEYVYVDVNAPGVVSVGDVRLTNVTFGGMTYEAGTQVAYGDVDLGQILTALLPISPFNDLLIIDVDSNGVFSTSDWVYLDINGDGFVTGPTTVTGAGAATAADLRLTNVNLKGQNYAFGTKVKTLDEDMDLMPRAIWTYGFGGPADWNLNYVDNVGPGVYGLGDTVYIKLPRTHFFKDIMTCDLRLTEYPY
jgi:hypothetical protein